MTTEINLPDGLTYEAEYVPYSRSDRDDWQSLNWKVTLTIGGQSLTTPYAQGIGHLPKEATERLRELGLKGTRHSVDSEAEMNRILETGKFRGKPLPTPELNDVLHCLLSDADAIEHPDFESWAGEFGYDTDSRKAEMTYRACLAHGLKLRAMLGDEKLQELRTAFQDY